MSATDSITSGIELKAGPQWVPTIACGKCGHEHHIDSATGEYQGRCSECFGWLRRPTDAEVNQFSDFMEWKLLHTEQSER